MCLFWCVNNVLKREIGILLNRESVHTVRRERRMGSVAAVNASVPQTLSHSIRLVLTELV